jgi:uncharacterized membrane protein
MVQWTRQKRLAAIIGLVGIAIELVAVALLAMKRLPTNIGIPIVVAGMFIAFVPMFVMSRNARR